MTATSPASTSSHSSVPPEVLVPDDEDDIPKPALPTKQLSACSRLLRHFDKIDGFKSSPAREDPRDPRDKIRSAIAVQIARSQLTPSKHSSIIDLLEDPLMEVGVGRRLLRGAKSPALRLKAAINRVRQDRKRASTYLVKKPSSSCAPSAAKSPPLWRRTPRMLKKQIAECEAEDRRARSWAAAKDALDEFMQRPAVPTAHAADGDSPASAAAPPPPRSSDLQALCRVRRRDVLLEMGVQEAALPPILRGYAAPRCADVAGDGIDALDVFLCGRA